MKDSKPKCLIGIICIFGFIVSCTNLTKIQAVDKSGSLDAEVDIYINGLLKGSGEVFHSDNNIFRPAKITLKKEGCQLIQQVLYFKSNIPKAIIGSAIAGLTGHFIYIKNFPLMWLGGIPSALIATSVYILSPVFFATMLGLEYKDLYTYHFQCAPL